jgi:hypothetical protein
VPKAPQLSRFRWRIPFPNDAPQEFSLLACGEKLEKPQVRVSEEITRKAKGAIDRMLELT